MTVEWFDLGQRLYADRLARPVPKLAYRVFAPPIAALAVRARQTNEGTTIAVAPSGGKEQCARDRDGLVLLASLGAVISADHPPVLLIDDGRTLPALESLARRHAAADRAVAEAAALCGWWAERAEHPGTSAVIDLPSAARASWVLGTAPSAELAAGVWRDWLGISDDSCAGMHEWAAKFPGGQLLPLLDEIHDDDHYSLGFARRYASQGGDWSRPDSPTRAALGLRSRCDSADLWNAALLADPLWRQRARYTGEVATGMVHSSNAQGRSRAMTVVCDRPGVRLRPGAAIIGWAGPIETMPPSRARFSGEIVSTAMQNGRLILAVGSIRTAASVPSSGTHVCLLPAPPVPATLGRARKLYAGHYKHRRWTPTPRRRDVPLDVIVAGAEDD